MIELVAVAAFFVAAVNVGLTIAFWQLSKRHRRCREALERARKERDGFRRAALMKVGELSTELVGSFRRSGLL